MSPSPNIEHQDPLWASEFSIRGLFTVFPSLEPEQMVDALEISLDELVLDIGGGGAPLPRADVVVERHIAASFDRDNQQAAIDSRWLAGDIQALPFADKAFDVAYCSHVLEHVNNPARACEELMRVAKRGYIETPRRLTEMLHGHPTHRWLIDIINGVLVFERRSFIESPLHNVMLAHALTDDRIYRSYLVEQRHLSCVQFAWTGGFEYKVIEEPGWQDKFDYDNIEHAGWSHFFFALNLLAERAPISYVYDHVYHAKALLPNNGLPALLACVAELIKGQLNNARNMLIEARCLGCNDASMDELSTLLSKPTPANTVPLPLGRGNVSMPAPPMEYIPDNRPRNYLRKLQSALSKFNTSR